MAELPRDQSRRDVGTAEAHDERGRERDQRSPACITARGLAHADQQKGQQREAQETETTQERRSGEEAHLAEHRRGQGRPELPRPVFTREKVRSEQPEDHHDEDGDGLCTRGAEQQREQEGR